AGNVGVALQAWIAHIERVAPGKIVLKAPQNPDLDFANRMDPQWQVWLYQFHLHKHLTRERLQRIFRSNEEEVRRMMNVLARAGAIVPTQGDVWEMNPFLQPFLAPLLRKENHHD
ncbi:MAG TPA: hypothetical protein PLG66_15445, partial [Calditrichia bacterium]|nr:hypothetical protein [Calditrichia bacterium]